MRRSVFAPCESMLLARFAITIRGAICSCGKFRSCFPGVFKQLAGLASKSPNGLTVFKGEK